MEKYLEDRLYVYRKSYNYYYKIDTCTLVLNLILSTIGPSLGIFIDVHLAILSYITGLLLGLDKILKIKEIMIDFQKCYKFYEDLLLQYRSGKINDQDIFDKESAFKKSITTTAVEKYLKRKGLNGYSSDIC